METDLRSADPRPRIVRRLPLARGVPVHRREVILSGLSLPLLSLGGALETFAAARGASVPFDGDTVAELAKALAAKPVPARRTTSCRRRWRRSATTSTATSAIAPIARCGASRACRSRRSSSIAASCSRTASTSTPCTTASRRRSRSRTDLFDYKPQPVPQVGDVGFAGFRLHAPINRADHFDEICTFLGASYFRAVAKGLNYGLSARGLALGTGEPAAEEFPVFTTFWLERPARDAQARRGACAARQPQRRRCVPLRDRSRRRDRVRRRHAPVSARRARPMPASRR